MAAIFGLAVVMHWPLLLERKTVSTFDYSYQHFGAYAGVRPAQSKTPQSRFSDPLLQFHAWDLAMFEGPLRFPHLWNPYAGFGTPLLANGQCAPFFPLKLPVYQVVGVRLGIGVVCLLKMILAGALMWLYLRSIKLSRIESLLGSFAFMACGFMVAWLQWPHTNVAILLPLLFLGSEKTACAHYYQGFLIVACGIGVGVLGGHPETLFHVTFASGLYLVVRTVQLRDNGNPNARNEGLLPIACFSFAALTGLLLSAVQLAPTLEYIAQSKALGERVNACHLSDRLLAILSPGDMEFARNEFLTYLLPNTFGSPSAAVPWLNRASNFNESAGYVGVGVLLLAVFSWRYLRRSPEVRVFVLIQLLSIAFVFNLPIVVNTLGLVPPFSVAANKRFLLVFCFSNAALAALALREWRQSRTWTLADLLWLALIGVGMGAIVLTRYAGYFMHNPDPWFRAWGRHDLAHFAVFLLMSVACLVVLRSGKRAWATATSVLLLVLTVADLYLLHFRCIPFVDPALIYPSTPALSSLQAHKKVRVLPAGVWIGPNMLTVYGVEDPRLYDAVTYAPLASYLSDMKARPPWYTVVQSPSSFSSCAGVRYLWGPRNWAPASSHVTRVWEDDSQIIYEDLDARPLAYLVSSWETAASPDQARQQLLASRPQDNTVVVERDGAASPVDARRSGPNRLREAQVARDTPVQTTVTLPDKDGGLLVLNDSYYPGWRAFIGARQERILRVNGAFRGVRVPPGADTVRFVYDPVSYRIGLWTSLITAAVLVLVAWRRPSRTRPAPASSPDRLQPCLTP